MNKSFKFRIYPDKEQELFIQKSFGCVRYVYNKYLARRIEEYELNERTLNCNACSAELTQLKRELTWLREPDASALQSSLKDLDKAYQNFFRGLKSGDKIGFPKFKNKKSSKKSYQIKQVDNTIRVCNNRIRLAKLGFVKCKLSREVEGRILSATISQSASGEYFVSLCCTDVEMEPLPKTGKSLGIDLGIKDFLVTSDGIKIPNPKMFKQSEKKLAKLQRQLSRKTIGSNNRNKARIKVARQHELITNQRRDFLQKLSTELIRDYDLVCLEDLQIQNMVKNRKLSKAISDVGWGEFVRELEYKALWYGKTVQKIDKFFPSSQMCSSCGAVNKDVKDLKVRQWNCSKCNTIHDRDINAATNILNEGTRLIGV